jgi:hypothetical protein
MDEIELRTWHVKVNNANLEIKRTNEVMRYMARPAARADCCMPICTTYITLL